MGKARDKRSEKLYSRQRKDNGNGMIKRDSQLRNMSHGKMSYRAELRKRIGLCSTARTSVQKGLWKN